MGAAEHEVPDAFVDFAENVSAIFQVLTFFVFGALIVATDYDGSVLALIAFAAFALLLARPVAVLLSLLRTGLPRPLQLFIAWFGPKGVASMLFALFVLKSDVGQGEQIFDIAAIVDPRLDHGPRPDRHGRGKLDRKACKPARVSSR